MRPKMYSNPSPTQSPFALVDDTKYVGPSDKYGRNYSPGAKMLTMKSLRHALTIGSQVR